jgi:hypothetical protein
MTRPTRVEVNCTTGEVLEIELTDAEIAQRAADAEEAQRKQWEKEAADAAALEVKEAAHAKLAALGLTAEEIAALSK